MALEDVGQCEDPLAELLEVLRVRDADPDERGDVLAQVGRVDLGDVAEDDPAVLELADPVGDARLRQPDAARDLLLCDACIALQNLEDPQIDGVHGRNIGNRWNAINEKSTRSSVSLYSIGIPVGAAR